MPRPICLKLLLQLIRRAASRAACTAGKSNPTKTPMMAMTTRSSTNVKPRLSIDRFIENTYYEYESGDEGHEGFYHNGP
jgi:hypothetical protein